MQLKFLRFLEVEKVEFAETTLEGVEVQPGGADIASGDRPLFSLISQAFPGGSFEEGHDLCDFRKDSIRSVVRLLATHALHDVGHDHAVRPGAGKGLDHRIHPLDPALTIGEGAALFEEGRGWQNDVCKFTGRRHEEFLDHHKIQGIEGRFDVLGIGVGLHEVFSHDPHGLELASERGVVHLRNFPADLIG